MTDEMPSELRRDGKDEEVKLFEKFSARWQKSLDFRGFKNGKK